MNRGATSRNEPPLTREQLQLGFRHLARPGWPATLDEALQHPVREAAIRGLARQLSRAPLCPQQPPSRTRLAGPPVPPTPTEPPVRKQAAQQPINRRTGKCAAANDFDD